MMIVMVVISRCTLVSNKVRSEFGCGRMGYNPAPASTDV